MKKLLAVFLALMMILSVSLMACQKEDETPDNDELEDDDDFIVKDNKNKETTDTNGTGETEDEGDDTSSGGSVSTAWVNESVTVYVRANDVNIRASASTKGSEIGKVKFGDALISESHNDFWYKVTYENATAYISADFVTANQNTVTFVDPTAVNANSIIKVSTGLTCNLRSDPVAADGTLKGSIDSAKTANGELTIIKINKAGTWAEVRFKGTDLENHTYTGTETLYCTTSVIAELSNTNTSGGGLG